MQKPPFISDRRSFSIKEIAEAHGVDESVVRHWITSGQLTALDVSKGNSKRGGKRYRVTVASLEAFEASRMLSKPAAESPSPRQKRITADPPGFVRYF